MTYTCEPTPYDKKTGPYSDKTDPYSKKANVYTDNLYCPVLLQEDGKLLLLEDSLMIQL